jgi:hypothetical protein
MKFLNSELLFFSRIYEQRSSETEVSEEFPLKTRSMLRTWQVAGRGIEQI